MCHEQRELTNGVVGESLGLDSSEDEESRADGSAANVNNGSTGVTEINGALQIPQLNPQGPLIHWERFLPLRSLKVLLVENDYSTRHVVSALLRNCSYEVTAVENALQAWIILENLNNHIDLILAEVVMPVLSGIGLLGKIMSHKTLKNIPVIMMSSHDSVGLVFKCLSKGAVDFLVKPIRKNELKNLWQHVWRRCHSSSSGSGSESGTWGINLSNSKAKSDLISSSSDEHGNGSDNMTRDGSDNGSGTQTSWTKKVTEVESSQRMSPSIQVPDAPDSTFAQMIHMKSGICGVQRICIPETKDCCEQDENLVGKKLEKRIKNPDLECECHCENFYTNQTSERQNGLPQASAKELNIEQMKHMKENTTVEDLNPSRTPAVDNSMDQKDSNKSSDAPRSHSIISYVNNKEHYYPGEIPSLKLTLRRLQVAVDGQNDASDDHNVLRHSELSAFSKYNTASSANQAPRRYVGSSPSLSSPAMRTETRHDGPSNSNRILHNQQSTGSSNTDDIKSTAKCVFPKPSSLNAKSESISAFKPFHSSPVQPVQNGHICASQEMLVEKAVDMGVTIHAQSRELSKLFQMEHHPCNHQVEKMQQCSWRDHYTLPKTTAEAPPACGLLNAFQGPTKCNKLNSTVSGSASGSNNGSNGPNGNSNAGNDEQKIVDSDAGTAGKAGATAGGGGNGESVVDEVQGSHREAALSKFRQKRKERCFEKRVRYHTRKKLAEKRPRVKGQFVRQIMSHSGEGKVSSDNSLATEDNSGYSRR